VSAAYPETAKSVNIGAISSSALHRGRM